MGQPVPPIPFCQLVEHTADCDDKIHDEDCVAVDRNPDTGRVVVSMSTVYKFDPLMLVMLLHRAGVVIGDPFTDDEVSFVVDLRDRAQTDLAI